jgi:hypothetical protein
MPAKWLGRTIRWPLVAPSHPSDSSAQIAAEATILGLLGESIGVPLSQDAKVAVGGSEVQPDGMAADGSVVVEVFVHIGKLRGGQRHKVSTDALKLLAIRDARPNARLILAFADEEAAASVSGWKAETLKANGIEIHIVDLDPAERTVIETAQARQKMVNASQPSS